MTYNLRNGSTLSYIFPNASDGTDGTGIGFNTSPKGTWEIDLDSKTPFIMATTPYMGGISLKPGGKVINYGGVTFTEVWFKRLTATLDLISFTAKSQGAGIYKFVDTNNQTRALGVYTAGATAPFVCLMTGFSGLAVSGWNVTKV